MVVVARKSNANDDCAILVDIIERMAWFCFGIILIRFVADAADAADVRIACVAFARSVE